MAWLGQDELKSMVFDRIPIQMILTHQANALN